MRVLGIDEAGRGPVIGPMVIAGVMVDEDKIDLLREIGVRDSKELSREKREEIFNEIVKLNMVIKYYIIPPFMIDYYVEKKKLNLLELDHFCKLIESLKPDRVFIDSFTKNSSKLIDIIYRRLSYKPEIIAETKADKKYLIVSAASIVAKVIRDREIDRIKEETGIDFGSGYPSDRRTIDALKNNYEAIKDYVRKSWFTVKKIRMEKQKKINEFFK